MRFDDTVIRSGIFHRFILLLLAFLSFTTSECQNIQRVHSGTRTGIIKIQMLGEHQGFFLAEKMNRLTHEGWERMTLPGIGRINDFYACNEDEFWYSATTELSTSTLFHYRSGKVEPVLLPLANDIHSMYIAKNGTGFFSSHNDVVVLEGTHCTRIDPLPGRGYIRKLFGEDPGTFWVNTSKKDLFRYQDQGYHRVLEGSEVYDFAFLSPDLGFILCRGEIVEYRHGKLSSLFHDHCLDNPGAITVSGDTEFWVTTGSDTLLHYLNGVLRHIKSGFDLPALSISSHMPGEAWIAGADGMLLYFGKNNYKAYSVTDPGFAAYRPVVYGIRVDNEYGVAMADFNNDGLKDIFTVCIYGPNRLFINHFGQNTSEPRWMFSEEAFRRGVSGISKESGAKTQADLALGVVAGDIDNDGDQDIYICSLVGKNKLFLNNGSGFFRDVSDQRYRACEDLHRSNSAVLTDADLDGDLDLFVACEEGSNRFFENDGTGHFRDITRESGLQSVDGGMCTTAGDINHDGLPDLCVTFWYPRNRVYLNVTRNGRIAFHDITAMTDLAKAEKSKSNAVVLADVNNDGHSDLFIANRGTRNRLYLNDGRGIFSDFSAKWLPDTVMLTNGAVFADFDLDGYLDLYLTNVGSNVLYRNAGGKGFVDVTGDYGVNLQGYSTGSASGDLDNDGDPDIYSANYINGNSMYFINGIESRNSLSIAIEGTESNRNATGAVIRLYIKGRQPEQDSIVGYREITGGGGYGSLSSCEEIFGIDPKQEYYAVVTFPATGIEKKINLLPSVHGIQISEETGGKRFMTRSGKFLTRMALNREWRPEMAKFFLVLMIMIFYLVFFRHCPAKIYLWRLVFTFMTFMVFLFLTSYFLFSSSLFLFWISPAMALTGLLLIHLITGRVMLKRLAEREKRELRENLSRDLHDDLASTLGSISIYAGTLRSQETTDGVIRQKLTAKIDELTHSALHSITDIIWMTAPRNETLAGLFLKVNAMMTDILSDNNIVFTSETQPADGVIIIPDRLRNNLFLILKEALHNIIRHSKADRVTLTTEPDEGGWTIRLSDNGIGFHQPEMVGKVSHGNGLMNMRRRAEESSIIMDLSSTEGVGTTLSLSFKI